MEAHSSSALLLLGSNIGDRAAWLRAARERIGQRFPLLKSSPVYETEAWGVSGQQAYLNQVIEVTADRSPEMLFQVTREIETYFGRIGKGDRRPRTIDIDLLFFGDQIVRTDALEIPHPRIPVRRFVLIPLADVAPDRIHPVSGRSVAEMLAACPDDLEVRLYESER